MSAIYELLWPPLEGALELFQQATWIGNCCVHRFVPSNARSKCWSNRSISWAAFSSPPLTLVLCFFVVLILTTFLPLERQKICSSRRGGLPDPSGSMAMTKVCAAYISWYYGGVMNEMSVWFWRCDVVRVSFSRTRGGMFLWRWSACLR